MVFIPQIIDPVRPDCPLCGRKFIRVPMPPPIEDYYKCDPCQICIKITDPHIGHWKEYKPDDENQVICPNPKCKAKMNVFTRSDGYMKATCTNPKCKCSIATSGEEK